MTDDETKPAAKKPAAKKPAAKPNPATKPIPVVAPAGVETQPTDVIEPAVPAVPAAASTEPEVVVVAPPKKKRRRWPWVLLIIAVVLAILLVIAYVIGENYAKNYARDYIKQRIVAVLGIEDPSTVKVDVAGPVLLQALAGKLNDVDVTAESVTFGTLSGAATVHAEGVPLDANAKTDKLDVTFAMPEDQVASALAGNLSGLNLDSIALEEPEIKVTSTLNLFFFTLPVGMGIVPSAEDGELVFTPTTVTLGDQDYTVDELKQEIGDLAGPLLDQQSLCVNESLPVALKIVDVDVVKKDLVIKINGDGVVMGGTDLSTPGTCAS
jgi:hypothetical protein